MNHVGSGDHHDSQFDRQPPQDLGAEQSVLGGMLLSKEAIGEVVEQHFEGRDFYRPAHQTIYDAILELYQRGEPADPVTVSAELDRRGELVRVGGAPYLHTLIANVPTAANATYYAEIVSEKAVLRRLVEAGTRTVQLGYDGNRAGDNSADVVARAHEALEQVTATRDQSRETQRFGANAESLFSHIRDFQGGALRNGIRTGLHDFDAVTNGLHPGQMIVVAARPGQGKSILGLQFARAAAFLAGQTAAIFSLEMSYDEIRMRTLAAECNIRLTDLRSEATANSGLQPDAWDRIHRRMTELADAPMFIDDSPNLTMPEIRAKARRLKQRHDLKLVVVDYLQLMTSGKRTESRQQEVSEFSRNLKLLAKELEVPVVAISQLNRGPESRTDKRPMLSDLRESGAIEQDADMVILINRPDAWDRDDPRAGEADLILAKHRDGPTVTITVAHQLHMSRFASLA
jgi:replicative DNA helicase